jgi:hypothetical protein
VGGRVFLPRRSSAATPSPRSASKAIPAPASRRRAWASSSAEAKSQPRLTTIGTEKSAAEASARRKVRQGTPQAPASAKKGSRSPEAYRPAITVMTACRA